MTRLALFVSACSVFLASIWLLVGRHEAGVDGKTGSGNQSLANHPPQTFAGQRLHDTRPRDDNNALPPTRDLQGARPPKGRSGIRGISVDRANIVETVTMDDLRAPEGRLWIPAALSGPISKKSPNPLFNVLVAYCQLDMAAYHEAPWLFAMGTFHQRHSGCLDDKSLVRTYRLVSLMVRPAHSMWEYRVWESHLGCSAISIGETTLLEYQTSTSTRIEPDCTLLCAFGASCSWYLVRASISASLHDMPNDSEKQRLGSSSVTLLLVRFPTMLSQIFLLIPGSVFPS